MTTCKFDLYYDYISTSFDTDEANDADGRLLRLMDTDEAMITPAPPLLHRHHHTCMENVKRRPKTTTTAAESEVLGPREPEDHIAQVRSPPAGYGAHTLV
ncbi:unnamed protein product [Urochloa humidicola]